MQQIRELLRDATQDSYAWRNGIAIAALASLMLPWVYLDGAGSSLSGAELIAYTLANGTERWDMLRQSFPGSAALFLVPVIVAGLCVYVFLKTWGDQYPVKSGLAAALLPLLIVLFSGGVTSSNHLFAGNLVFPQPGIILLFLCQGGLTVYNLFGHAREWDELEREPEDGAETATTAQP